MESQRFIRRVAKPTNCVNFLAYVTKRDNTIIVCPDPQALNKALIRPCHQIPKVEEYNHRFAVAKSILDAKSWYWYVKLDHESQTLTTSKTPFRWYCFERLPFHLNVSPDIDQLEMYRILKKCTGACDIAIFGLTEHEEDLRDYMKVATQKSSNLNFFLNEIKHQEIFFGNLYTHTGMKPDPQQRYEIYMWEPRNKNRSAKVLRCDDIPISLHQVLQL